MTDTTERLTIGPYLRAVREHAGLSQTQLRDQTGIDQAHISGVENGRIVPGPALLDPIILALDLDRDEAYHRSGRIPPELASRIPHDLPLLRELRERFGL